MGRCVAASLWGCQTVFQGKLVSQQDFLDMLKNGLSELQDISTATVGDKCLMDTDPCHD
ncbi:hypothetical protein MASR2M36_36680 [Providencia sp.]